MKRPNSKRRSLGRPGVAILLLLAVAALCWSRCSVREPLAVPPFAGRPGLELPAGSEPQFVVQCLDGRFTFGYDTTLRRSVWVAHVLTRADAAAGSAERSDSFTVDPAVSGRGWPGARTSDYAGSGYDRGHLVPSADRVGSQAENDATFRLSNIAPQHPALNRGVWNSLEQQIRRLAARVDSLWIVTGTLDAPTPPRIGAGDIAVPEAFYKVILARRGTGGYRAIAFVVPNGEPASADFKAYATAVDRVEERAAIDFYPALPEPIEEAAERTAELRDWNW